MKAFTTGAVVAKRSFHRSAAKNFKVGVVGAAGGIGQPLSLLLKLNPNVTHLSLYDLAPVTPGVGADLGHMCTPAKVSAFSGDEMSKALDGCDVVVIPAGVPRKPGMTRDDLFNINAGIVSNIAKIAATACPKAMFLIISNPVNSTVPIVAETLKKCGVYDKNRVFGVTTLDVVRARTFVAENQGTDVNMTKVSVVGGHAGITILPLLSQVQNGNFSQESVEALTQRIAFGGDEVVKAKAGAGSATLSMAYAGERFADAVMRAMKGEEGVVECTYVESDVVPGCRFFSTPVELGKNGVKKIHGLGELSAFEQKKFDEMLPELKSAIQKGEEFVSNAK